MHLSLRMLIVAQMNCNFSVFVFFLLITSFATFHGKSNGSHVSQESDDVFLPIKMYWSKNLPNTPIPAVIQDQLVTGFNLPVTASKVSADAIPRFFFNYRTLIRYDKQFPSNVLASFFFLEKKLRPGAQLNGGMSTTRFITNSAFIPRSKADTIPFTSTKLSTILQRLSVLPGSLRAKNIRQTLEDCEQETMEGEQKFCATSLESMIDFATSQLQTHSVMAITTTMGVIKGKKDTLVNQLYTVAPAGIKKMGTKLVACHQVPYPYTVYYCHLFEATKVYVVELIEKDGTKVKAATVCHTDTSRWDPMFFKTLGAKPGIDPICHFLPQDHIVWTTKI